MTNVTSLKTPVGPALAPEDQQKFDQWFDARFEQKMKDLEAAHVPSMAIIATKGTIDWAYPPFILASTRRRSAMTYRFFHLLRAQIAQERAPISK